MVPIRDAGIDDFMTFFKVNLMNPFYSSSKSASELMEEVSMLARLGGK